MQQVGASTCNRFVLPVNTVMCLKGNGHSKQTEGPRRKQGECLIQTIYFSANAEEQP